MVCLFCAQALGVRSWPTWGCEASKFPWSYDSAGGWACHVVWCHHHRLGMCSYITPMLASGAPEGGFV